jgi:hypothetical protein
MRFLAACGLIVFSAFVFLGTSHSAPLPVETSWIGNSFGGPDKWVQDYILQMEVASDGTCYTQSIWDEAHREYGVYKDGDVIGNENKNIDNKRVVDSKGSVWQVQNLAQQWEYGTVGTSVKKEGTGIEISGFERVTGLAIDNQGRLMIADDSPGEHVIKIYDISGNEPALVETFGEKGGIGSGTPGEVTPKKFWGITGCGTDATGNIYVSYSQEGGGIRCFTPEDELKWEVNNWTFVDCADFGPDPNGNDIYGVQEHYVVDYSLPPGKQWTLKGYTMDLDKYPEDPRMALKSKHYAASPFVRQLSNDRLYMYVTGMLSWQLSIFRFDGEIAAPVGLISKGHIDQLPEDAWGWWPPNQPSSGEWLWLDGNGDGKFDAGEYERGQMFMGWAWWVDGNGDIWQGLRDVEGHMYQNGGTIIRKIPLSGFDDNEAPVYRFADAETEPVPPPFNDLRRIIYFVDTDVMYLSGYTTEYPNPSGGMGPWKELGTVIARFDNWSTGNRTARFHIVTPWINNQVKDLDGQVSFAVAGEYVFVCGIKTKGVVRVYSADDGAEVGTIEPGATVGGVNETGWVDIPYGMSAMRRPNDEYVVLVEEDWKGKILMYRWCPSGDCPEITVGAGRAQHQHGGRTARSYPDNARIQLFFDMRGNVLKITGSERPGNGCYIAVDVGAGPRPLVHIAGCGR